LPYENFYIENGLYKQQPGRFNNYFLTAESIFAAAESILAAAESTVAVTAAAAESTVAVTAAAAESTVVAAVSAALLQATNEVAIANTNNNFFIFFCFNLLFSD
jgi:hypothetical protein